MTRLIAFAALRAERSGGGRQQPPPSSSSSSPRPRITEHPPATGGNPRDTPIRSRDINADVNRICQLVRCREFRPRRHASRCVATRRDASAVVSERSDPMGLTIPHLHRWTILLFRATREKPSRPRDREGRSNRSKGRPLLFAERCTSSLARNDANGAAQKGFKEANCGPAATAAAVAAGPADVLGDTGRRIAKWIHSEEFPPLVRYFRGCRYFCRCSIYTARAVSLQRGPK